ncbi:galactose mutarotase-like domain-containing protein, partial [Baffinella frigidus]
MRVARTLFLSLLPLLAASTLASGMATVTLRGVNGASAEVAMHGAHVISFTPDDKSKPVIYTSPTGPVGKEVIYTSPTAKFDSASAIRGGIPICFPQFGPRGALPAHGFSRKSDDWTLVSTDADLEEKNESPAKAKFRLADTKETRASEKNGSPAKAEFRLADTEATRASAWPHPFEAL